MLGPGLRSAATAAWARHAELTARLFTEAGWDPEEFVGFRCETAYPVWRAGYFMSFNPVI